jgi:ferrochelatase
LAQFISATRMKKAKGIYQQIGGKSPLLENTVAQAEALEESLKGGNDDYKVFIAMRYWHPFTQQTVDHVKEYNPDEVILFPLYPHYSTTTTQSSFEEWYHVAADIKVSVKEIQSYQIDELFIESHVETLMPIYKEAESFGTPRILFSAHSLPQKIIDEGDPYQKQTEQTARAIVSRLQSDIDYVVCYQSRVGPLQWLKPTTEDVLKKAAIDKVPVVVVPISFVSEHSETLVELDIDYRDLAKNMGIPFYGRVPTVSCHPLFIKMIKKKIYTI